MKLTKNIIMYNIFYKGIKLNNKPIKSLQDANNYVSLNIINYGYKPEIIPIL